jgi:hypothetical protein
MDAANCQKAVPERVTATMQIRPRIVVKVFSTDGFREYISLRVNADPIRDIKTFNESGGKFLVLFGYRSLEAFLSSPTY